MIKGIYTAAHRLSTGSRDMGVIANNLANLNSVGYKRETPFSEILTEQKQVFVRQVRDFSQGELDPTGNPLDLAINGNGFFVIETENGREVTRDGQFSISDDGFLVTKQGDKVLGAHGEINLKDTVFNDDQTITISKTGQIRKGKDIVDNLLIAEYDKTQELAKTSGQNFKLADPNEDYKYKQEDDINVSQGFLEGSNVNAIVEMENMIQLSKDYESAQKVVRYLDQSLGQANEAGKV